MAARVPFRYFLADLGHPILENNPLLQHPLPLSRMPDQPGSRETSVTYEDYFQAVTTFLSGNRYSSWFKTLQEITGQGEDEGHLGGIDIFLMKHGEFYHPSRVSVNYRGIPFHVVVNVAISRTGLEQIQTEFQTLKHLHERFRGTSIPRVFDFGEFRSSRNHRILMFLGEWFEDFHEFHYGPMENTDSPVLQIWDGSRGKIPLDAAGALELFTRASALLTGYYDFFTSHHIGAWHHAAGDFVVNNNGPAMDVKLITVRKYHPLANLAHSDPGALVDALLVFFLNLTVKMRLDRLDGVKEMYWIGTPALEGAVKGFFKGLEAQVISGTMPEELVTGFRSYLRSFKAHELKDWCDTVVGALYKGTREMDLIQDRLSSHVKELYELLALEPGQTG